MFDRLLPAPARVLVEGVASFQIQTVRFGVHDPRAIERLHENIDAPGDIGGDFALEIENLADVAFVRLCPQVHVRGNLDQLRRDPHAASGVGHGTFHDRVDVQLPADFR